MTTQWYCITRIYSENFSLQCLHDINSNILRYALRQPARQDSTLASIEPAITKSLRGDHCRSYISPRFECIHARWTCFGSVMDAQASAEATAWNYRRNSTNTQRTTPLRTSINSYQAIRCRRKHGPTRGETHSMHSRLMITEIHEEILSFGNRVNFPQL